MAKDGDNKFLFNLKDTLRIKATGGCFDKVITELKKNEASRKLQLYLNYLPIKGLDVTTSINKCEAAKELIIGFHLDRDSNNDESRKAWDKLLRTQDNGYKMKLPVEISIGNEPAFGVQSAEPFELCIVTGWRVTGAIVLGLIVFIFSFRALVKNPSALRDQKNGCYSLGKSQMAFWGLLILLVFTSILLLTGTMERIPDQVLILLGISGSTGLSAILIGGGKKVSKASEDQNKLAELKKEREHLENVRASAPSSFPKESEDRLKKIKKTIEELPAGDVIQTSSGFWRDICDDGNGMSFHRLQVVIWTLVLGGTLIYSVAETMSMPEFSKTLLILLGISNGIYLGFKFPEKA